MTWTCACGVLLIEIVALQDTLRADLAACNTALRDGLARWDADKAALRQEVVALGRDRVSTTVDLAAWWGRRMRDWSVWGNGVGNGARFFKQAEHVTHALAWCTER